MKTNLRLLRCGFAALLFAGCVVQSLNPLFTERDFIPCPGLVGTWVQQEDGRVIGTWVFTADGRRYECTQTDEKGRKATFHVSAGKLGPDIFLDASLRDTDSNSEPLNDLMSLHLIPGHVFVKAVITNDSLRLLPVDLQWLSLLLESNPKALPHVMRDKRPILTASTEELKGFVAKYANDPQAFRNEIKLIPRKAAK